MKVSLKVVQFESNVMGPGDKQHAKNTSTFAIDQKFYPLIIELDTDTQLVTMVHTEATMRDTVVVPVHRVVQMEPVAKPAAKKVA